MSETNATTVGTCADGFAMDLSPMGWAKVCKVGDDYDYAARGMTPILESELAAVTRTCAARGLEVRADDTGLRAVPVSGVYVGPDAADACRTALNELVAQVGEWREVKPGERYTRKLHGSLYAVCEARTRLGNRWHVRAGTINLAGFDDPEAAIFSDDKPQLAGWPRHADIEYAREGSDRARLVREAKLSVDPCAAKKGGK